MFLGKGVLKICTKFVGKNPCWSVISMKLQSIFIKTTLRYGFSPVNLLHIFRTPFRKNTSWWMLLEQFHKNLLTVHMFLSIFQYNRNSHQRCSVRKSVLLEISTNSQEKTYASVSDTDVFPWIFRNILECLPLQNISGRLHFSMAKFSYYRKNWFSDSLSWIRFLKHF